MGRACLFPCLYLPTQPLLILAIDLQAPLLLRNHSLEHFHLLSTDQQAEESVYLRHLISLQQGPTVQPQSAGLKVWPLLEAFQVPRARSSTQEDLS